MLPSVGTISYNIDPFSSPRGASHNYFDKKNADKQWELTVLKVPNRSEINIILSLRIREILLIRFEEIN